MHIRKAALVCDHCEAKMEIDPTLDLPCSTFNAEGKIWEGWLDMGDDHHLCPECADEYKRMEENMRRELTEFAGFRRVTFDL